MASPYPEPRVLGVVRIKDADGNVTEYESVGCLFAVKPGLERGGYDATAVFDTVRGDLIVRRRFPLGRVAGWRETLPEGGA